MKFSFPLICCFSLLFMISVVPKLSKIRRTKNDSVLRGFFPGDEKTQFSHNLNMVERYRKLNLNPLSFQLSLHKYGELIFASNLKSFFESMYKGFVKVMYKFEIKPNYKKKKKIIVNYELLDSIKCEDVHQLIDKNFNFRNLSYEMSTLNKYNYLLKPRIFITELQRIASNQATNCPALTYYINLFYTQTENLEYLNNQHFKARKILDKAKRYKENFIINYGKYRKMGYYLGKLFGWYIGYPQSSIIKELKINSLMNHL